MRLGHVMTRSGTPGRRDDPLAAAFWITLSMALLAGLAAFGKYLGQQGVNPLLIACTTAHRVVWVNTVARYEAGRQTR